MYWKLLEQLKKIDHIQDDETSPISGDRWHSYYSELLCKHPTSPNDSQILTEITECDAQGEFNPLSYRIELIEVDKAINKELKTGKAAGPDGICPEIIKCMGPEINPILTKLFNGILSKGDYPNEWGEGIITSIHKKAATIQIRDNPVTEKTVGQ